MSSCTVSRYELHEPVAILILGNVPGFWYWLRYDGFGTLTGIIALEHFNTRIMSS
jgi:hypothetical protein